MFFKIKYQAVKEETSDMTKITDVCTDTRFLVTKMMMMPIGAWTFVHVWGEVRPWLA